MQIIEQMERSKERIERLSCKKKKKERKKKSLNC